MTSIGDYHCNEVKRSWCPGCGDFGIEAALKSALSKSNIEPKRVMTVGGIGCSGLLPYWTKTNSFVGLHGRALPAAIGMSIADPGSQVVVMAGDGDAYGIGVGHLVHAFRRNQKLVYMVANNGVYALTKGQVSPTAELNAKGSSTPFGINMPPIDPISLALISGGTFVARGFAGDIPHLAEIIERAIAHEGFSFIDILQPCVSYHKNMCDPLYAAGIIKLEVSNHDAGDLNAALTQARGENGNRKVGIFYCKENNSRKVSDAHVYAGCRSSEDILGLIRPMRVTG
ncbi:MAG: thiamine pyrophosphate-dependent enzyme [Patescibacteria group bacterium]